MSKIEVRRFFLERRKLLSPEEVKIRSQLIADNFLNNLLPKIGKINGKTIAYYIAINNEADPKLLINLLKKYNPILALPKITGRDQHLSFIHYNQNDELSESSHYSALYEPIAGKEVLPEIVLIPLVAFDRSANRIGMGGGFYDRTIQILRRNSSVKPLFIGLAYDFQLYDKLLPVEPIDQNLDFIVSETGIVVFKGSLPCYESFDSD